MDPAEINDESRVIEKN